MAVQCNYTLCKYSGSVSRHWADSTITSLQVLYLVTSLFLAVQDNPAQTAQCQYQLNTRNTRHVDVIPLPMREVRGHLAFLASICVQYQGPLLNGHHSASPGTI